MEIPNRLSFYINQQ